MSDPTPPAGTNVAALLQQALAHHQAGRLQEAEPLYRAVLQAWPRHPDANHNLGVLAMQLNRPAVALEHLKVALDASPAQGQYWLSYIAALMQAGQLDAARQVLAQGRQRGLKGEAVEALARRLGGQTAGAHPAAQAPGTARAPGAAEISQMLGLFNQGRYAELEPMARALTLRSPGHGFAWKLLGALLKLTGRSEEALAPMERAAALLPGDFEAHYNLGNALRQLRRLPEAAAAYRRVLALKSDLAEAHCNLGATLDEMGQLQEAAASYHLALEVRPDYAEAHTNLGNTLRSMGRPAEAEASHRRALAVRPDYAEAFSNLANTLRDQARLEEAEACCRRALEINADLVEAHCSLGGILQEQGRFPEAEASLVRALEIKPDYAEAYSNLLFLYGYRGQLDPAEYLRRARGWEQACLSEEERQVARTRVFSRAPSAGRRLRVGYVSGDYRHHAVSFFVEQLFTCHDRERVELFAYCANAARDAATERLQALVEHWEVLVGLSDAAARDRIEADGIDVLIDLSGHTAHNRLGIFARRAAPVQAHYLGYFASTGLSEMDYWIGDEILTPAQTDSQFQERVWRLPRVWVSYEPKAEVPAPGWRPAADGTVWVGGFNNLGKLTPQTLALWARVLHALPEGRLLLKTKDLADAGSRQRILDAMAAQGISHDRIELQDQGVTPGWSAHMAYYDRLDIALDPVGGVGGGTTTCDALWMGAPVVALEGDRMASRMTASMLAAIGHPEWSVRTEEDYVSKAVALARDVEGRTQLRRVQREQMAQSPLCNGPDLARGLESAYFTMFERWIGAQRDRSTVIP